MLHNLLKITNQALEDHPDNSVLLGLKQWFSAFDKADTDISLPDVYRILSFEKSSFQNQNNVKSESEPSDKGFVRDYRLISIFFKGVRKFPSHEDFYYSLDFSANGLPASTIILGANGSGKSSVFSLLEWQTMRYSFTAESHGHNNDQVRYILHTGTDNSGMDIILNHYQNVPDKDKIHKFVMPAFFCSENDIVKIDKYGISWDYIVDQLGLKKLADLIDLLKSISDLIQLVRPMNTLSNGIERYRNLLKDNGNDADSAKNKRNLKRLERKQVENDKNIKDLIGNSKFLSKVSENDLQKFNKTTNSKDKLYVRNLKQAITCYENHLAKINSDFYNILKDVLPNMMRDFLEPGEEISVTPGGVGKEPEIKIIFNGHYTSPSNHLNTFRSKVFTMALKLSMVCCCKNHFNFNFPFVVDDIFISSDFNHRLGIGRYISKMLENHNKNLSVEKYPFQLIYLTQDEIVGEGIYNALCKSPGQGDCKYVQLFDYNCIDKDLDKQTTSLPGISDPIIHYNLSDPIKTNFPTKATANN